MESSAELRRSKQLLKLSTLVLFFMILCVGGNVVYGGKCDKDWASLYACYGGNRRSLPDDVSVPRGGGSEWKKYVDYLTLLKREALSTGIDRGRHSDAAGHHAEYSDAVSEPRDDHSFGDVFDGRRRPESSDMSRMLEALRRSSVDGSYPPQPESGEPVDMKRGWSRGRTPWLPGQRSDAVEDRKRSAKSNDVSLDAAVGKVEELIARRRLLDKWLKEVKDRLARKVRGR